MRRLKTSKRVGNLLRVMSGWGVVDAVVSRLSAMVGCKIVDCDQTSELFEIDIVKFPAIAWDSRC